MMHTRRDPRVRPRPLSEPTRFTVVSLTAAAAAALNAGETL